jgi:hypothetical protein
MHRPVWFVVRVGLVTSHDNRAVLAFFTSVTSHDIQGAVQQLVLFDIETNGLAET